MTDKKIEMTNKELRTILSGFPDDMKIEAMVDYTAFSGYIGVAPSLSAENTIQICEYIKKA